MSVFHFTSNNESETKSFAKKLASKLQVGDIIVLSGELGSGKTKFTEGILSYFNLENEISSPTFTIVNEYLTPTIPIYHFDVYRLEDSDELFDSPERSPPHCPLDNRKLKGFLKMTQGLL